ncbi:MAG TPA: 7TM diverse intracellular signaling domain-containing protein [Oligoflexus sp.]|uniref:7TM diverse intracellular signaling domain-containing protein n=1 Tax=Oligoflexus sp. TaxID=1971216 RepID=UPI002D7E2D1D|nr:7TM diverse intracellular signaling domain-containing protein [Oligoflexus sp.]HET9240578.1 7TM diverse intracellular signaling domain-containing protein [Oligoflexus sp.]
MRQLFRWIIIWAAWMGLTPTLQAAFPVQWSDAGVSYWVEDQPATIHDVMQRQATDFKQTTSLQPNVGFSAHYLWFSIALKNTDTRALDFIFEVAYPRLEDLDLYAVNGQGQIRYHFVSGSETPAAERPIHHVNYAFPIRAEAGEDLRFYIRTRTDNPLRFPVKVWPLEQFRAYQQQHQLTQGLYYGGIVIMVIYNLFVFFGTRNRSYLFYCLFVFSTAAYLASDSGLLTHYVFTDSSFWNNKITLVAILGANVFGLYFAAYFMNLREHDPLVNRQISRLIPVLSSMLLAVPFFHYHVIGIILTIVSTLNSLVLMLLTVRGLMRKQREAYFYAAAWSSLLLGTFTYGLLSLGFIQPNFFTEKGLQLGSFFEVTILSFALADRLNQLQLGLKEANSRLAHYLQHVEEQVLIKTRDIRSIMEHIPMGVFSIIPGLKVHKDHSLFMEKLFYRKEIEGMDAIQLLFEYALIDADQKAQMASALQLSIGEDQLAFELNRPGLLEQVETQFKGERRILHLLWNPVCNDAGVLEKVLVTAHDITRLLMLEDESRSQRQELGMIRRILEVPVASFHSFVRKAEQLLQECEAMAEDGRETYKKVLLFHIHTLKGTARSLYFNEIAELCHHIEEKCAAATAAELKVMLGEVKGMVHRYRDTAVNKLGRRLDTHEDLRLPTGFLRDILQDLAAAGASGRGAQTRMQTLEAALFRPLNEVLKESLKATVPLALELGKAEPRIEIAAEGWGVTQAGADMLMGVLTHLVRNSMDHGLEPAGERQKAGKNPQGLITVTADVDAGQLKLAFADDGRGLNLKELRKIGMQKGLIQGNASLSDVVELVFQPELSTQNHVSLVSGRGIGMAAVRDYLRREGGDAVISLGAVDEGLGFVEFSVNILLPPAVWSRLQPVGLSKSA